MSLGSSNISYIFLDDLLPLPTTITRAEHGKRFCSQVVSTSIPYQVQPYT
jgi:hypothetical protein